MLSYTHTNVMIMSYTPVTRPEKLSNQVAEHLQHLILSKTIKPGERLPTERELGEQFQVSRTVIREAIRILEARGLLDTQTGSGTYVKAMQGEDVSNSLGMYLSLQDHVFTLDSIMEVRRVLELQVVKLASMRATNEDLDQLEETLNQMCLSKNEIDSFSKWDLEFHLSIAQASNNELFRILIEPLGEALFELIRTGSSTPGAIEEACEFHREILIALKNRDAVRSVELMKAHLDQSQRVALEGKKHLKMQRGEL